MSKYKEIFKLKRMLEKANIPFEFIECFGYDKRLLSAYPDIMGLLTPWERYHHGDSVIGWLTAENVFKRIKKDWEETK